MALIHKIGVPDAGPEPLDKLGPISALLGGFRHVCRLTQNVISCLSLYHVGQFEFLFN